MYMRIALQSSPREVHPAQSRRREDEDTEELPLSSRSPMTRAGGRLGHADWFGVSSKEIGQRDRMRNTRYQRRSPRLRRGGAADGSGLGSHGPSGERGMGSRSRRRRTARQQDGPRPRATTSCPIAFHLSTRLVLLGPPSASQPLPQQHLVQFLHHLPIHSPRRI